jgi:hypothetical protein
MVWESDSDFAYRQQAYRDQIYHAKKLLVAKIEGIMEHGKTDSAKIELIVEALSDFIQAHKPRGM